MGLPITSISNYQEVVKKLVHQLAVNCYRKMSTTNLFNIRQGPQYSLSKHLTQFNEATCRVVP